MRRSAPNWRSPSVGRSKPWRRQCWGTLPPAYRRPREWAASWRAGFRLIGHRRDRIRRTQPVGRPSAVSSIVDYRHEVVEESVGLGKGPAFSEDGREARGSYRLRTHHLWAALDRTLPMGARARCRGRYGTAPRAAAMRYPSRPMRFAGEKNSFGLTVPANTPRKRLTSACRPGNERRTS